jgi:hypothetical protein
MTDLLSRAQSIKAALILAAMKADRERAMGRYGVVEAGVTFIDEDHP